MSPVASCRRLALVVAATAAAVAATAAPVMAARAPAAGCPDAPLSNPFAQWGDSADYQLATGGDVEDGAASWSLSAGAAAVEGNETFMVTSPSDHLSLRLPSSSSAMTGRTCIGLEHPTFRLFAKRTGGSPSSRLLAEVVFTDSSGRERAVPAGLISGSSAWAPTAPLPTIVNVLAPTRDNALDVSFRFKPQDSAVWSIDDVYIDPRGM